MSKFIWMVLLTVMSGSAMAEWVKVDIGENNNGYADLATIRKNGDMVKMWILFDFKTVQKPGAKPFMSIKRQEEYDCKEEQSRTLFSSHYSKNMAYGETVYTFSEPDKWTPVSPGSVGESFLQIACEKVEVSKKEVAKEADVAGKDDEDYKRVKLEWENAITTFFQEVKVAEGLDYLASENSNLSTALDIEVKKLGNDKEYANKGYFFFLCEAHKKVMRQFYSASYDPVKLGGICASPGLVAKDSPASVVENSASSQKTRDTAIDRWKSVHKSAESEHFIDTNSIRKVDGLTYVWEKLILQLVETNNSNSKKTVTFLVNSVINCNNHTVANTSLIEKTKTVK